jgi:hypothetical protein
MKRQPAIMFTAENLIKVLRPQPMGPGKFVMILCDLSKRLAAFDRYERRALSRRKSAFRALDAAGFKWPRARRDN